jgi:hypothetical protein
MDVLYEASLTCTNLLCVVVAAVVAVGIEVSAFGVA